MEESLLLYKLHQTVERKPTNGIKLHDKIHIDSEENGRIFTCEDAGGVFSV